MLSSGAIIEETEKLLKEVLETIRQEGARPDSVLCETDRREFVREEERLSMRLKETSSGSRSTVLSFFGLPSASEQKCLKDAKALRQRVKENIDDRVRTRLSGESNPPSSNREPGSAVEFTNPWSPEADIRPPFAEGNSEVTNTSMEITSPANPRFSLSELPGLNVDDDPTTGQEAHDHRHLSQPIDTRVSSDRSSGSSIGGRRKSHTTNARARWGSGRDESCYKINNSNLQGWTVNHDSMHCSGAVMHTVMLPPRSCRPASQS